MKDTLFSDSGTAPQGPFVFDQRVANVFDDMVNRSVPGYQTIQLLVADLACRFAAGGVIYDLGCSTGATISAIDARTNGSLDIIGIDNSAEMIAKCRKGTVALKKTNLTLSCMDLTEDNLFPRTASVIILNLTLQFVRPPLRRQLVSSCHAALKKGGALILVEKTVEEDPTLNNLYIDYYHAFKEEMGYSQLEIAAKREALENVLVPYRREENFSLLEDAGFLHVGSFFQWFNFLGVLAVK